MIAGSCKVVSFGLDDSPEEMMLTLRTEFPGLTGGFELMRCLQNRRLVLLPQSVNSPRLIKESRLMRRSRLYVRPLEVVENGVKCFMFNIVY